MSESKFYSTPGGFLDSTDFVERKSNGDYALHLKDGTVKLLSAKYCGQYDDIIAGGRWVEVQPPEKK